MKYRCSGGFDPIHSGHLSYINAARKYGEYLIIALIVMNGYRQKRKSIYVI